MIRRFAVIVLLTIPFLLGDLYAQDPEFSQFYANPLYLNPALAGVTVCPKVNANYRNQWPAIGKAFITYNASYDQYVSFLHGGLGLVITADRAGSVRGAGCRGAVCRHTLTPPLARPARARSDRPRPGG